MKKTFAYFAGIILIFFHPIVFAKLLCDTASLAKKNQSILACYLAQPENISEPWVNEKTEHNDIKQLWTETYTLSSQYWPKTEKANNNTLWKHKLIIYRPDMVTTEQALLFVNGGTRNISLHLKDTNPEAQQLDFARIAIETHSIVVDLEDIPNQYLTFDDRVPRKEDGLVAYTWNRYLDDPIHNIYWPLHLPMTKAIIKAMDAVQQIELKNNHIRIKHFVVSGASKRGWATWLAALSDKRINAIIPIVINMLNMKANLDHTYATYQNQWPIAFYDYINQKIPERFNSPEFAKLIKIEDPIAYLSCSDCSTYRKRLNIPKYIISASSDDFFVPDSLNIYFNQLPGENRIRVAPNQRHYIDMKIVENSILPYYQMIIQSVKRPHIQWQVRANKLEKLTTDRKPENVTLWQAENPNAQDFRATTHIEYQAVPLSDGICSKKGCQYSINIASPLKGWKATFIEVVFRGVDNTLFVVTTPVYVTHASSFAI